MSGLEVAGLVLGAFPLLISALEHYRQSAEVLGIFWKIRREHKLWIHDLRICELAFERNLEALLLPLIIDDDAVKALIRDPGGPRWQDPSLETRLRERLPDAVYPLYLETIGRIQCVMEDIQNELGVAKGNNPLTLSKEASLEGVAKFQALRLKMSLSKSKRDDLFRQLTKGNDELRELLDSSDRTAALRKTRHGVSRAGSAVTRGMWRFWRQAERLYTILQRSWLCECREAHLASLLLQPRSDPEPEFCIGFSFGPWKSPLWEYLEIKANVMQREGQEGESWSPLVKFAPIPSGATQSIESASLVSTLMTKSLPSSHERRSSFRKSIMAKFSREKSEEGPKPASFGDTSPISTNTGSFIAAACVKDPPVIFLVELNPLMDDQHARRPETNQRDALSLDTLLKSDTPRTLTRRERYWIALTLASSYLQLKSSPWIPADWSKEDIVFTSRDDTGPRLDQPRIRRDFRHGRLDGDVGQGSTPASSDRTLAGLGIMLLELCFGTAIEEHETRKRYPQLAKGVQDGADHYLNMAAAFEWLPRAAEEAGPEFSGAIEWCLKNMPGSGEADGKADGWREELFEKVVVPLKYCSDQFTSARR